MHLSLLLALLRLIAFYIPTENKYNKHNTRQYKIFTSTDHIGMRIIIVKRFHVERERERIKMYSQ